MPTHPENDPDDRDPEDEGWTPEKEKNQNPEALLGKLMGMAGKVFGRTQQHMLMAQGLNIVIRPIANGYLVRYLEVDKRTMGAIPIPGAQEKEVFVKDLDDAIPILRNAFGQLDILVRTAQGRDT